MTIAAVLAGAVAGALLAVVEVIWLRLALAPALAPLGGTLGLLSAILPRGFVVGAALGLFQGLYLATADWVARRCGQRRWRQTHCFAALVAAPMTIAFLFLAQPLLQGRQARSLADHPLLLLALGTAVAWCFHEIALVARLAPGWIRSHAPEQHARAIWRWTAAGFLVLATVAYVSDRLVLVRLYESCHWGLRLTAFASLELAILAACSARMRPAAAPRLPRWLGPSVTIVALGLAIAHVRDATGSRTAAVNLMRLRGAIGGSLVSLADTLIQNGRSEPEAGPAADIVSELATGRSVESVPPLVPGANILLVTIDALRADHLEAYGYPRATSPHLARLAHDSVVIERAYTSAPHTSFALASLLTGHPAMSLSERGLLDDTPTLGDLARASGYRTAAFFPPAVFFVDGERFKSFRDRAFGFEIASSDDLPEASSAATMTDQALAYLTDRAPERFLLWAHYFAPHEPYVDHPEGGPPFGKRAIDRYDGEIRWVDREVGRLVDAVRARYPRTIVVITADHGEEFGDHGGAYHGTTLFDEQVKVPLIISIPGTSPRRIAGPISTTSLAPTLLGLVGVNTDAAFDGPTLAPWLATPASSRQPPPIFAENAQQRMIAWGNDKLICDTRTDSCVMFDLSLDPGELVDVSLSRPERARSLRGAMAAWVARQDAARGGAGGWARLNDPQATPSARRDAVRSIARRPDRARMAALHAAWSTESDPSVRAWLAVALAAIGDAGARAALPSLVTAADDADDELLAQAALARDRMGDERAASDLATTLPRIADVNLRCALMHALAKWRTPLAAEALVREYDVIRSRVCCASALSTLRDPATVPFMLGRLPGEPYIVVQTALVRALGTIGDRSAVPVLRSLRNTTSETELVQTIDGVLSDLDRPPGT